MPACGSLAIIIPGFAFIKFKQLMTRDEVLPFNNVQDGKNASILGFGGALIVTIMMVLLCAPFVYMAYKNDSFDYAIAHFMYMMFFFVPSIVNPSIFFMMKPKLFKSAVDLFKEAVNCQ